MSKKLGTSSVRGKGSKRSGAGSKRESSSRSRSSKLVNASSRGGPPDVISARIASRLPKVADQDKLDTMLKKMYDFKPGDTYIGEACPLTEGELM